MAKLSSADERHTDNMGDMQDNIERVMQLEKVTHHGKQEGTHRRGVTECEQFGSQAG